MNLPGYSVHGPVGFDAVRYQLQRVCQDIDHEYWGCDVSLRSKEIIQWQRVMGQNQITDVYLLALAVKHKGALATLDQRIAIETVSGAQPKHLLVL
jgi:uncharacterized protein